MNKMIDKLELFSEYIELIENKENRIKFVEVLEFVTKNFPHLETVFKWNQPMFTDHNTFIIAFSVTKNHINIAPERAAMIHFEETLSTKDVDTTKMLIQMKWTKDIDFTLIEDVINYNIFEKKDITSFWR